MSRPLFVPTLGALALILLTACTSSSQPPTSAPAGASSSANAQTVSVQATDALKFDPSSITVKAGQPVQLTLNDAGQMQHDWTLQQGADKPVNIVANAGQSASGTFTIQTPGTYTFICSVPGHAPAGMQGTITAQ